jgi:hypothetical protein
MSQIKNREILTGLTVFSGLTGLKTQPNEGVIYPSTKIIISIRRHWL